MNPLIESGVLDCPLKVLTAGKIGLLHEKPGKFRKVLVWSCSHNFAIAHSPTIVNGFWRKVTKMRLFLC